VGKCRDPRTGRWYLDASWKAPARSVPPLEDLRKSTVVAVDVNAGHLAVAIVLPDGNVSGVPFTIPLDLAGLPAVLGRRGLGHRARRRATGNRAAPEDAARPAQVPPRATPAAKPAPRKRAAPPGRRPPHGSNTGPPDRTTARNQAPQDRPAMPTEPTLTKAQC